jgi:hypothetical protein
MKKLLALLVAVGLVTGIAVFAEGDTKPAKGDGKKTEATATDIEITGKVAKQASKKDEKEFVFTLEMADGKAYLPKSTDDATNPEKFLDKTVTVKGKGVTKEKEGKKMIRVTEITSITENK